MKYDYIPEKICPTSIKFDIEDNIVTNISFTGGCNGNLKAIAKVVDGWTVERIEKYFLGNTCGNRLTSCTEQLAIAVRRAYDEFQEIEVISEEDQTE